MVCVDGVRGWEHGVGSFAVKEIGIFETLDINLPFAKVILNLAI